MGLLREYGIWGGPNELLEAWAQRVHELAGESDRLTESERLLEAETKMDFAQYLFGYIAASFYDAYESAQSQWRSYAGVKLLRNFNEHRIKGRNRLTGFGYIGDHAHYPGMRRTFRPEASLFLDTYGGEHEVTRQAIINQETQDILVDDPREMGEAAADFLARAIWALIISNPNAPDGAPMYSVGRGNQTSLELSENSLMIAASRLSTQRDDDDRPIRTRIRRVVVQNALMVGIINRILHSQQTGVNVTNPASSTFDKGTANVVPETAGLPQDLAVEEPYMPDANDWYAFGDPARNPAFVVALLQGQEEPFIGREEPSVRAVNGGGLDPYQLKIDKVASKVRWDLGTGAVEPKTTYRGVVA